MVRVCGECVWLVCVERIKWWVLVVGGGAVDITPPTPPHKRTGLTASCAAQSGDEYGWGGVGEGSRLGVRKIFTTNR